MANPWVEFSSSSSKGRLRLFCIPYAGRGASLYHPWLKFFPEEIEVFAVQLPGRETRLGEKPFRNMAELVPALARGLEPHMISSRPAVVFGHSMGALVAFELSRFLRCQNQPSPIHLFVSGCRAPQLPRRDTGKHRAPDSELLEDLRSLGGTPSQLLDNEEFIKWYLPTLRADFAVCDNYQYLPEGPLDCSITALHGANDAEASHEESKAWAVQTARAFSLKCFPGGHFFIQSHRSLVQKTLLEQLTTMAHFVDRDSPA